MAQLVPHHAAFDGPFLSEWYQRLDIYRPAKRQLLCTLQLALWRFGYFRPRLGKGVSSCPTFFAPFQIVRSVVISFLTVAGLISRFARVFCWERLLIYSLGACRR